MTRRLENRVKYFWIPQGLAVAYYQVSRLLFVIRPRPGAVRESQG